jgi:L-ascorbate metabolism protein UlaG (beta-lactamase superfamily)
MDITYLGHSSFKIKTKTASVVTDPFDTKMVGLKYSPQEAEIVTISHSHQDHNAIDRVSLTKKIINGPGEYEVSGVTIIGLATYHDNKNGDERGKNTIYVIEAEGLRLLHLGDLGHQLDDKLLEEIGDVDILMIPVGGFYTLGPKEATDLISKIEPYYVMPMHYKVDGMSSDFMEKLSPVETFLKESGMVVENLPKFSIKREDILEDQNTKIVLLEKK